MIFKSSHQRRVGLFGGAFDPPHIGHVEICRWLFAHNQLDEIWAIPCFFHPFGKQMIAFEHRLTMCRFAFTPFQRKIIVSDIERELGGVSHTLRTILHIKQQYPSHQFHLIAGSDNEERSGEWLQFDEIKRLVRVITVPRGKGEPIPAVSSTAIRSLVQRGEPFSHLVPKEVAVYIITHQLYR